MRHLPIVLCVSAATALGFASFAEAGTNPLAFTLDLTAPCGASGCTGVHPTDIALDLTANAFTYQVDNTVSPSAYVAQMDLATPLVCDEIAADNSTDGAKGSTRLAPSFSNPSPGGLLEFAGGGSSVIDLDAVSYFGNSPAGVAGSYGNAGGTAPQVVCYGINPISGGAMALANGTSIYRSGFETLPTGHFANEPWVSVSTVLSPQTAARTPISGPKPGPNGITPSNVLGFVVQVHNASHAVGWRLKLGYDAPSFDPSTNGQVAPQWCILGSNIPQPGALSGSASCSTAATMHTFSSADVQSATNSIFIYGQYTPSSAGTAGWASLTPASFPAVAAIFPPYGTFPQRFDDKVAVASANNKPVLNVASIVGSNNAASTSNTLRNSDGSAVPASTTYTNSVNASGATTVDPLVYFIDPTSNTTLPGTTASDGVTVNSVTCDDPQHILAAAIDANSFTTSTSARGAMALNFSFAQSGALFVPGTATCTATFTVTGFSPALSTTETFTITMPQATATHFSVSAPANATAGQSGSVTITALDGGNNAVGSYSGSVTLGSTDTAAVVSNPVTIVGGQGTTSITFKTSGSQTVTATDSVNGINGTSGNVAVAPAAATHFRVSAPANATVGNAFGISVTALDPYNNTDDAYAGTVHFTSSDNTATLPGDQTLTFGVGTPSVTLGTAGGWTITATDTVSAITGSSGTINAQ